MVRDSEMVVYKRIESQLVSWLSAFLRGEDSVFPTPCRFATSPCQGECALRYRSRAATPSVASLPSCVAAADAAFGPSALKPLLDRPFASVHPFIRLNSQLQWTYTRLLTNGKTLR